MNAIRGCWLATLAAALCLPCLPASAQEAQDKASDKEFVYRQQHTQEQFRQFLRRMGEVADALEKSEPASARAIRQAVQQADRAAIAGDMAKVADYLRQGLASMAGLKEAAVVEKLKKLLQTLLETPAVDSAELAKLKLILGKIKGLLDDQQKHRKALADLPEGADPAGQKKPQDETADKTDKLGQEMKGDGKDAKGVPGQKSVASAADKMKEASSQLGKGRRGQAGQSQDGAIEDLKKAERELTTALDDIRRTQQEQTLVRIEALLREILEAQRPITRSTTETYAKGVKGQYERAEQLELSKLSEGEGVLAEKTGKALKLVQDEGTAVVFPQVLEQIKGDLSNVQKLLSNKDAGPLTQAIQKDVERNLEDLLAALEQELAGRKKQRLGPPPPPGDPNSPPPPLVSPVAEMKMLRTLQKQINGRTLVLDAQARNGAISKLESEIQHKIVADREAAVSEMTKALAQKTRIGVSDPGG